MKGAAVANHVEVLSFDKDDDGKIIGVELRDNLTGETWPGTHRPGSGVSYFSTTRAVVALRGLKASDQGCTQFSRY